MSGERGERDVLAEWDEMKADERKYRLTGDHEWYQGVASRLAAELRAVRAERDALRADLAEAVVGLPRERVERVERRTGAATFRQGDHRSGADRRRGMLDAAYYAWRDGSPRPRSGTDRRQAHAEPGKASVEGATKSLRIGSVSTGATPETREGLVERLAAKWAAELVGEGFKPSVLEYEEARFFLRAIADECDSAHMNVPEDLTQAEALAYVLGWNDFRRHLRTEASR